MVPYNPLMTNRLSKTLGPPTRKSGCINGIDRRHRRFRRGTYATASREGECELTGFVQCTVTNGRSPVPPRCDDSRALSLLTLKNRSPFSIGVPWQSSSRRVSGQTYTPSTKGTIHQCVRRTSNQSRKDQKVPRVSLIKDTAYRTKVYFGKTPQYHCRPLN